MTRMAETIIQVVSPLSTIGATVATTVASATLGASPWYIHLLYFAATGLLWILPAMLIIKWMEKPGKPGGQ